MERKLSRQMRLALKIDVTNGAKVDDGIDVQSHQEQVLRSVRQMQTMQRVSRRLGGIEFMVWQLRYIGKDIWMAQGFTVLLVFTVLYRTIGQTMGNLPARYIPMLLGILAVLTLMVSIPFLQRPYKYRMYEIELATRISLPRILAADLALMTIGNLIVFTVGGILAHGGLEFPMARTWIYLCLPFLAAGGGCARIMKRTQNWEDVQVRIGVCEG